MGPLGAWIVEVASMGMVVGCSASVSKHMGQVQDNPSIMCIGCSEDGMALNTIGRLIVHHV